MSLEDLTVDQLLARAKQTEGSHALFEQLTRNPETREMLQRAMKKANPNLVIPEIDASDKVLAAVAEERKAREKLENEIRERDVRERIERQRAEVKSKYKLTDSDVTEVEKLMLDKENPIPTYDAAARVYVASRTPSTPTPASLAHDRTFQMPEKDVWGKGIGNPAQLNKIAMDEAYAAWGDIRGGKVAGLGPAVGN